MSTGPIEVAEEALKKLDELKIVDKESKDKAEAPRPPRVRLSDEERRRIWEEKQAKKPVLETGVKGKVKWYSVRGKYGFISRDDEGKDVFVHQTAISKSPIIRYFLRTLADEEEVVFDVVDGDKGPEAANVTGPNGEEVKGSKYYHVLIRRRSIHKKDDEKKKSEKDEKEEKDDKDVEKKKSKKKSNKNRRPRRVNKPKKEKENGDSKEDEAEEEEESAKEEVVEKPARRRSTGSEKAAAQTKVASPKGSGDASLGAENTPTATVH